MAIRSLSMSRVRKRRQAAAPPSFEHTLLIRAAPTRVVAAFFDPHALSFWWQTVRSVTIPRMFGAYAVEWEPTPFSDELLGPLGGAFFGTIIDFHAAKGFAVADAVWLPPAGEPIGPMALDVSCGMDGPACRLTVRQTGYEESARWKHYYDIVTPGWHSSLAALKRYLEEPPTPAERGARRRL
jgi:hypothetical protein